MNDTPDQHPANGGDTDTTQRRRAVDAAEGTATTDNPRDSDEQPTGAPCEFCGNPTPYSPTKPRKYCSDACRYKARGLSNAIKEAAAEGGDLNAVVERFLAGVFGAQAGLRAIAEYLSFQLSPAGVAASIAKAQRDAEAAAAEKIAEAQRTATAAVATAETATAQAQADREAAEKAKNAQATAEQARADAEHAQQEAETARQFAAEQSSIDAAARQRAEADLQTANVKRREAEIARDGANGLVDRLENDLEIARGDLASATERIRTLETQLREAHEELTAEQAAHVVTAHQRDMGAERITELQTAVREARDVTTAADAARREAETAKALAEQTADQHAAALAEAKREIEQLRDGREADRTAAAVAAARAADQISTLEQQLAAAGTQITELRAQTAHGGDHHA